MVYFSKVDVGSDDNGASPISASVMRDPLSFASERSRFPLVQNRLDVRIADRLRDVAIHARSNATLAVFVHC